MTNAKSAKNISDINEFERNDLLLTSLKKKVDTIFVN